MSRGNPKVGEGTPGKGGGGQGRQGGLCQTPGRQTTVWSGPRGTGTLRDWGLWGASGTANCGAMVMAASISRCQGPSLPACWADVSCRIGYLDNPIPVQSHPCGALRAWPWPARTTAFALEDDEAIGILRPRPTLACQPRVGPFSTRAAHSHLTCSNQGPQGQTASQHPRSRFT